MKARFQSYLSGLFRRPVVDRFQTPLRRRAVAVTVLIWQMLLAGSMLLIPHDHVLPALIGGVVMVYLLGMLNMSTRGIFELTDEHLDELQISMRDAAYRKSYFLALFWLLMVAPVTALTEGDQFAVLYTWSFIFLGFLWSLSAPRVVVAWSAPADETEA